MEDSNKITWTVGNKFPGHIYVTVNLDSYYIEENNERKLSAMTEFKEVNEILQRIESKFKGE